MKCYMCGEDHHFKDCLKKKALNAMVEQKVCPKKKALNARRPLRPTTLRIVLRRKPLGLSNFLVPWITKPSLSRRGIMG